MSKTEEVIQKIKNNLVETGIYIRAEKEGK